MVTGKTVAFITMGCAKNEVDSSLMASRLQDAGYGIIDDASLADVVVVNTCSFIQAACEESIEAILDAADLPLVQEGKSHLIVAGCLPARYADDLEAELPEASAFVSCSDEEHIVSRIDVLFGIERLPGESRAIAAGALTDGSVSAYVKISDGCDRFCSYCTIPYIRGRYHSFAYEDINCQVGALVDAGVREVVLIAQDTGRWGADFDEPLSLAWLLDKLARDFPDTWFRVMYIQPEGITDELLRAVSRHQNVCRYFDIPFQHSNADILASMNRSGSGESFLELIERVRSAIPDATLRTTLIAGFPGETDEQFEELCDFVSQACLDYVGVFPYSREEGTRAYKLEGQLPDDEKLYRAQRIRDLADDVSATVISQRIGSRTDVLVCGREEDGQLFGRTMGQAPDVDGVTFVDAGEVGDIVPVVIDDTLLYEMDGTVQRR